MTQTEKKVAREKARKRWHESVADGKVKLVKDLSEREKRSRRRSWREAQRRCKRNKSADDQDTGKPQQTSQKRTGRKRQRRDQALSYRTIRNLKNKLKRQTVLMHLYKKDGSDTKINQNHDMWSHKIVRGLRLVNCWDAITFPRKSNVHYSFTIYWLQISESVMLIQKIKERKLHSRDWFVGKLSNGTGLIPCYQNQLVFLWREQV